MCFQGKAFISPQRSTVMVLQSRIQATENTTVPLEQNADLTLGDTKKKLIKQIHGHKINAKKGNAQV